MYFYEILKEGINYIADELNIESKNLGTRVDMIFEKKDDPIVKEFFIFETNEQVSELKLFLDQMRCLRNSYAHHNYQIDVTKIKPEVWQKIFAMVQINNENAEKIKEFLIKVQLKKQKLLESVEKQFHKVT